MRGCCAAPARTRDRYRAGRPRLADPQPGRHPCLPHRLDRPRVLLPPRRLPALAAIRDVLLPRALADGWPARVLWHPERSGHWLQKRSNSPFRTPPRNARHSSGVNRRNVPSVSLLWRTPTRPSGRLATSTQLLLEKLRELLIQDDSEPGPPARPLRISLPTSLPR